MTVAYKVSAAREPISEKGNKYFEYMRVSMYLFLDKIFNGTNKLF